jgi:hypothetical protein
VSSKPLRFVQLTCNGEPCLFNVGHILTVEPIEGGGSRVQMSVQPGSLDVLENYDDVKDLLLMATEVDQ